MPHLLLVILFTFFAASSAANFQYDEDQQLAKFSQMIGGKWWLNEFSYQTFSWGLAKTQIKMTRVFIDEGEEKIVTEGIFYYSPDTYSIKGISTSIIDDGPPQLLEYIGTITDDTLELIYKSISPDGVVRVFSETWIKASDDKFHWRLETMEGESIPVTGTYVRKQ